MSGTISSTFRVVIADVATAGGTAAGGHAEAASGNAGNTNLTSVEIPTGVSFQAA